MSKKPALTPYLVVHDPAKSIAFLVAAFGAEERYRTPARGKIVHAEVRLGESRVMLGAAPEDRKPSFATFHLSVPDVDVAYARALAAGGKSLREPADQEYGERSAGIEDPDGNQWWPSAVLSPARC
jgi:uncharacterized glyoxalase superfamily protein PhnB